MKQSNFISLISDVLNVLIHWTIWTMETIFVKILVDTFRTKDMFNVVSF